MRRIVVIPFDSVPYYVENKIYDYKYFDNYFNPDNYFQEVYCLSPWGKTQKISNVKYIQALPEDFEKIIREIKPDIVRTYGGADCCDWAVASKVSGIPVVASVHDPNWFLMHQSLKFADYILATSKIVAASINKKLGIDEKNIIIKPNGIDIDLFCKRIDLRESNVLTSKYGTGKHILHVGRKSVEKNIDTVIKALTLLPKEYKAIFIGKGVTQKYEELAKKEGVYERCFFEQTVNNRKLPYYYSWCDCMCTPSRWEGFGYVFVEAAACECAIVTSNISPMNEYFTDGIDSILVEEYENPSSIAEGIIKACADGEEVKRLKRNARKVGLRFSNEKIAKQEKEIYEYVLERGENVERFHMLQKHKRIFSKKIIIYGMGKNGIDLLNLLNREDIAFIVDNDKDKQKTFYEGIEIIGHKELEMKYDENNYWVVVTPYDRSEIENALMASNIEYMDGEWLFLVLQQMKNIMSTDLCK